MRADARAAESERAPEPDSGQTTGSHPTQTSETAAGGGMPDDDGLAGHPALRALHQALELARAREARLREDNHRLAEALEQAEQELAALPALRDDAEVGRRARDAAVRLEVLESSASWKLTRPLRSLSLELRRVAELLRRG